jgi:hypothetical protein
MKYAFVLYFNKKHFNINNKLKGKKYK